MRRALSAVRVMAGLALIGGLIAALPTAQASARTPREGFGTYVAMGDSYSSGEGLIPALDGPYDAGTATAANTCHRHALAWPRTLQNVHGTRVVLACSGARIGHLTTESKAPDEPPQIQQLAALGFTPDLITVTIGGNDLGFSNVIRACIAPDGTPGVPSCQQAQAAALAGAQTALPGALQATYQQIRATAPSSRLVVVGYPSIFPARYTRRTARNCPWLTRTELQGFVTLTRQIEQSTVAAATAAGVGHVSLLRSVKGHDMCADPARAWINPLAVASQYEPVLFAHPNAAGQAAIRSTVDRWLAAHSRTR